jgi:uncharacterized protein YndB with AHSA1/START domain
MNDAVTPIAPVRKSVTVSATPAQAFDLFTRDIATWWPLETHSVGHAEAVSVTFGSAAGDPIVETLSDGTTESWGTVLELDRPHRLAIAWHAGRTADAVTHVEVTFSPDGLGGTVVELVHSDWEQWGDGAKQAAGYREGWDTVIQAFVDVAMDKVV